MGIFLFAQYIAFLEKTIIIVIMDYTVQAPSSGGDDWPVIPTM
jgi:hypothetical protein